MQRPRGSDGRQVTLSKFLTKILRHSAHEMGFKMGEDGYIAVDELLAHHSFKRPGYTLAEIQAVVASSDKQRFNLENRGGKFYIRANQGHSIEVPQLALTPITDPARYPRVMHGTYFDALPFILKEGLSKMTRTHIHFTTGEYGSRTVISGMRRSCEALVYIDLARCIRDGIPFVLSSNEVILSTGDATGHILPKYFIDVVRADSKQRVPGFVLVPSEAPAATAAAPPPAPKPHP